MSRAASGPKWTVWLVGLAVLAAGLRPLAPTSAEAVTILGLPVVTNVTDTSFTVSWVTDVPSGGYVRYGTSSDALSSQETDDRGSGYVGYTHYVQVRGVLPGTRYYFGVTSGNAAQDSSSANCVWTGATLGSPPSPSPNNFTGTVYKSDGATAAAGSVVYVQVQHGSSTKSAPLSALANDSGEFTIDVSAARTLGPTSPCGLTQPPTPSTYYGQLVGEDHVFYQVDGGLGAGGVVNRLSWQSVSAATTSVEVVLPLQDAPTPTATPSSTPTGTSTASPTGRPTRAGATASPSATTAATAAPPATPTRPATPTTAASATAMPALPTTAPAAAAAPSPNPPTETPVATPTNPLPRPLLNPPGSGYAAKETATPRPSSTPQPTAGPSVSARPDDGSLDSGGVASEVTGLLAAAGLLIAAGLGLAMVGLLGTARRRSD